MLYLFVCLSDVYTSYSGIFCNNSGWMQDTSKVELTKLICCLKYRWARSDSSVCLQRKTATLLLFSEERRVVVHVDLRFSASSHQTHPQILRNDTDSKELNTSKIVLIDLGKLCPSKSGSQMLLSVKNIAAFHAMVVLSQRPMFSFIII